MENASNVLNAKEAASFLKDHVETTRWLARRGAISVFKACKDRRFYMRALRSWPEGQSLELPGGEHDI